MKIFQYRYWPIWLVVLGVVSINVQGLFGPQERWVPNLAQYAIYILMVAVGMLAMHQWLFTIGCAAFCGWSSYVMVETVISTQLEVVPLVYTQSMISFSLVVAFIAYCCSMKYFNLLEDTS